MEIKPASFGENLNEWFQLLGRTWKQLFFVSLIAFFPVAVVVGLLFAFTTTGETFADLMDPDFMESLPPREILDFISPIIWMGVIWAILQTLATLFVYLASARIVAEERAGMEPTWRAANSHAWSRFLTTVLGGLMVSVAMALVSALAVTLGWLAIESLGVDFLSVFIVAVVGLTTLVLFIWVGLSVAFYPQVLAMEDAGAADGLRRSFDLVQGRWWPTAGFVLVASLIASAVAQVASIALLPLAFAGAFVPALLGVVYGLAILIQGPFTAAIAASYAVWYLDLRARKEPTTTDQIV